MHPNSRNYFCRGMFLKSFFFLFLFFSAARLTLAQDSVSSIQSDSLFTDSVFVQSENDTAAFKPLLPIDDNRLISGNQEIFDNVDIPRAKRNATWWAVILFIPVVIFAYMRLVSNEELISLRESFINLNIAGQNNRDQEFGTSIGSVLLMFNFFLVLSLYLFLLVDHFNFRFDFAGFRLFIVIFVFICVIVFLRTVLLQLVAFIFRFGQEIHFFQFNFFAINKIMGLVLFPFVLTISYAPEYAILPAIYISLATVSVLYIFLLVKGFIIARQFVLTYPLHFFIYLCALEIAPVLIWIKLINIWSLS